MSEATIPAGPNIKLLIDDLPTMPIPAGLSVQELPTVEPPGKGLPTILPAKNVVPAATLIRSTPAAQLTATAFSQFNRLNLPSIDSRYITDAADQTRYKPIRRLGAGGMGQVFLTEMAIGNGLNRPPKIEQVAVKVQDVPSTGDREADAAALARLRREAMTTARLQQNPHIARLYAYGVDQRWNKYFTVMPVADGSLADKYANMQADTRFAGAEHVYHLSQVGDALQFAHNNNALHMDIKPANVLIGEDGQLLLSDFGLARPVAPLTVEDLKHVDSAGVAGTPEYMAKEQCLGQPTPLSDQYALAVMAYRMFTGGMPHTGINQVAVMMSAVNNPAPRFEAFLGPQMTDMHRAVEGVIQRALQSDQYRRYPSVTAFTEALEAAMLPHFTSEDKAKYGDYIQSIAERQKGREASEKSISVADDLIATGHRNAALSHYDEALRQNPTSLAACYKKASLLDQMGHTAEALVWYRRTITMPERSALDLLLKGKAFMLTAQSSPDDSGSATYIGREDQYELAIKSLEAAIGFYNVAYHELNDAHAASSQHHLDIKGQMAIDAVAHEYRDAFEQAALTSDKLIELRLRHNNESGAIEAYQKALRYYQNAIHDANPEVAGILKDMRRRLEHNYTPTRRIPAIPKSGGAQ